MLVEERMKKVVKELMERGEMDVWKVGLMKELTTMEIKKS